jgi:hypothetical protein
MLDPVILAIVEDMIEEGGGGGSSGGYKGSVATASALPTSGSKGDIYLVTDEGAFYVYDGGWNAVKETAITTAEIDALWP